MPDLLTAVLWRLLCPGKERRLAKRQGNTMVPEAGPKLYCHLLRL